MSRGPEETIAALREKLSARNDTELARKLRVNKRTISSWKNRGRVPDRFLAILDGAPTDTFATPPQRWGNEEQEAFTLALYRTVRALGPTVAANSYPELLTLFSNPAWFWFVMDEAQKDVARLDEPQHVKRFPPHSRPLYEDTVNAAEVAARVRATIRDCFGRVDGKPIVLAEDDASEV